MFLFSISGRVSHQGPPDQLLPFLLAGLAQATLSWTIHHAHHQSDSRVTGTLNKTLFLIWMYQCFFIFFGVKLTVNSLQLSFTFVECSNYLSFLFCRVYRSILWQSSTSGRRRPRTGTSTSSSTTKDWAPRRLRRPRSVSAKCSVIESSSKASLLR